MDTIFEEMAARWKSSVVARTEIEVFTGGLMSEKYQANIDSMGLGPERFRCGRKIAYPVRPYVEWLSARSKIVLNRTRQTA